MRQYIVNLTDNLIGKNRYDEIVRRIGIGNEFVRHVKIDLECGDVRNMSPETLGKIMCSFEVGDVVASQLELFEGVHFSGDCEEMLRELVSLCLAYVIRDRLDTSDVPGILRWRGQVSRFKQAIDRIPSGR
ncbi:MAG: hypothetical protein Q7K38_00790 [Candidatus Wildermuthbacteria bacterium]|nr:hypothetical protein [Candidatus Wildermuthbacteria bacterium]